MSQTPQNPFGNLPPYQPAGQQLPPYGQQAYPAPAQTSGAAIASLILGIVGICVPVVGGLLAIAGLILGVLTLLGWGAFGGVMAMVVNATAPDRATARTFLTDVSAGNTTAAAADCVPGTSPDQIQSLVDTVKPLGPLNDSTFFSASVNSNNGTTTSVVAGKAVFGTTPKGVTITLAPGGAGGKRLVQSWQIQ